AWCRVPCSPAIPPRSSPSPFTSDQSAGYARWRNNQWVCTKEPLTAEVLMRHFQGICTLGAYVLEPEHDTCRRGVIDLDNHGGEDMCVNWSLARRLCEALGDLGISYLCESSNGNYGFHIWVFWADPIPARICRRFLHWLVDANNPWKLPYEVFPK